MNSIMSSVFGATATISIQGVLLSVLLAFALGAVLGNIYYFTSTSTTKGFVITIALIPPVTCVILLLISKNFGAGLAVAGAFALIKFKSVAGTAKEIVALFISIGVGIACGSGFLMIALISSVVIYIVFFLYCKVGIWKTKKEYKLVRFLSVEPTEKTGGIESVEAAIDNYIEAKTLIGTKYAFSKDRQKKTLQYKYRVTLKSLESERELIDQLVDLKMVFDLSIPDKKRINQL